MRQPDDMDDCPMPRPLRVLASISCSERPGSAFKEGISLPISCEEWFAIQSAIGQVSERVAQPITDHKGRPMTYWGGKKDEPPAPPALGTPRTEWGDSTTPRMGEVLQEHFYSPEWMLSMNLFEAGQKLERELAEANTRLEHLHSSYDVQAAELSAANERLNAPAIGNELGCSPPQEIMEWMWHMDLHLTEHDERHAGLALRAAWPPVKDWIARLKGDYVSLRNRLNAKVPEVEEQVRMAIVSFRLGDREAPVEVVPADLARDLGRRLAAAHATIDAAGAYEFRENILRGTMTDALERAEAAESAQDEAVAKERERCAKECELFGRNNPEDAAYYAKYIAAAIRSSSEGGA